MQLTKAQVVYWNYSSRSDGPWEEESFIALVTQTVTISVFSSPCVLFQPVYYSIFGLSFVCERSSRCLQNRLRKARFYVLRAHTLSSTDIHSICGVWRVNANSCGNRICCSAFVLVRVDEARPEITKIVETNHEN